MYCEFVVNGVRCDLELRTKSPKQRSENDWERRRIWDSMNAREAIAITLIGRQTVGNLAIAQLNLLNRL